MKLFGLEAKRSTLQLQSTEDDSRTFIEDGQLLYDRAYTDNYKVVVARKKKSVLDQKMAIDAMNKKCPHNSK